MLVLKVCAAEWNNASRDKRELSACEKLGMTTAVLAKGMPDDYGRTETVDGFLVYRCSSRPLGPHFASVVNRIVSVFRWAGYIRRNIRPDIISGHDLSGLLIAWISNWFRGKNKAKLVYDSHEFEAYRNCKRSELSRRFVMLLEHFLIQKTEFSIMVNDSIADEVQRMYKLKKRPVVVRSTPYQWDVDANICEQYKLNLRRATNSIFVAMYHGAIMNGRGIEALIHSISQLPDVGLVILGNSSNSEYLEKLKQIVSDSNVINRVLFLPAVPVEELWKYVGAADVSMANISPIVKSYYYALPNKFFESIQSLTPIIASDLPEMRKIVEQYDIGLLCAPDDVEDICHCLIEMRDEKTYVRFKRNLTIAKAQLCWEKEEVVLMNAYSKLMTKIGDTK